MMSNPRTPCDGAPLDDDTASVPVTWQDMWIAADIECERAEGSRRAMRDRADMLDDSNDKDRRDYRKIAADFRRVALTFEKIRTLIDRASTDPEILGRLREIAAAEKRAHADAADETQ